MLRPCGISDVFHRDPWVYQITHTQTHRGVWGTSDPVYKSYQSPGPTLSLHNAPAALFTPSLPSPCTPITGLLTSPFLSAP